MVVLIDLSILSVLIKDIFVEDAVFRLDIRDQLKPAGNYTWILIKSPLVIVSTIYSSLKVRVTVDKAPNPVLTDAVAAARLREEISHIFYISDLRGHPPGIQVDYILKKCLLFN